MKRELGTGLALLLASFFVINGCAKDRTQDDKNQEDALNKLAQYKAIEGHYSGMVYSEETGKPIGGLQLVLEARLAAGGGNSGGSGKGTPGPSAGTATLISELDFEDFRYVSLPSVSGDYYPESGTYQGDFYITRANGQVIKLSVTAQIGGGKLTGNMRGDGHRKKSGSFTLDLNGPDIDSLAKASKPSSPADEGKLYTFTGRAQVDVGDPKAGRVIELKALYPVLTPLDHFLEVFFPETSKNLQIDVKFGQTTDIVFAAAVWDINTGMVNATNPSTGGVDPWIPSLRCEDFHFEDTAKTKNTFSCDYWSNRSSMIHMIFNP